MPPLGPASGLTDAGSSESMYLFKMTFLRLPDSGDEFRVADMPGIETGYQLCSQLLRFVILLLSTATRDLPSVVGWTPVSRTILVAVSVLPYRRWFASLSGSTVAPPRDTPANNPSAFP